MQDYKTTFNTILENLKRKRVADISLVEKAFSFAEKSHEGQIRKSGLPYIAHPVEVTAILEKLDFDSDVLSAALLHDVVEDCQIDLKQIEKEFNKTIALIVDAVTEINSNERESYENEIKTYQKLVSMGKHNRFAFFIKFADRLHNLRTIDVFPRYKQIEKIKQTHKFIVPLAKLLKTHELYSQITNECFKILADEKDFAVFKSLYDHNLYTNQKSNNKLKDELTIVINSLIQKTKKNVLLKDILIKPLTELEIKEQFEKYYEFEKLSQIKQNFFVNVPNFRLFLIFEGTNIKEFLFTLFEDPKFKKHLSICGYDFEKLSGKDYFLMQNSSKTKFQLYAMTPAEYIIFRNGSEDGVSTAMVEDDFEEEIVGDYISVKTRSNEILFLPTGSTVLDFAFKIHKDIGFAAKYAHLNDSPLKTPIWTKLSEGDKVNVIIEEDEFGKAKNIAKLKWLTFVNNEKSKKILLKYFEKLYE